MTEGLRARARQRQARPGGVEFGASQSNTYFTSRRLRVPRKKKPPPRTALKQQEEAQREQQTEVEAQTEPQQEREPPLEEDTGLHLPARGELLAALKETDEDVGEHRQFEEHFPAWKSELLAGYNLLFYGVGSKLSLLQEFASSHLNDGVVMQVHGYLPVVSLRYLANAIQEQILQTELKPNQSISQQCRDIAKAKLSSKRALQVYLIVHSIDGLALRTPEAQTCLSWLAKAPFVAVVASMDHINGPSIWKEEDSLRFEWLCQNLDTGEPYTDEVELRLTKRVKAADATSSGVKFILQSLTPTDVATLQELARQQLAGAAKSRARKPKEQLPAYQAVYEACRRKLLHSTPLAMKNSVKCLEDHGLLKQVRVNTIEYLQIPLADAMIKSEDRKSVV